MTTATIDLGKIKFKWRGQWSNTAAYEADDVVQHGVSSWICTNVNTNSEPSNTSTNWDMMITGGTDYANGGVMNGELTATKFNGDGGGLTNVNNIVKVYHNTYKGGSWQTGTGYSTLPGSNNNFIASRSDTKIRYRFTFAYGWQYNSHSIQHMIFYMNNAEQCRWTIASTHNEGRDTFEWVVNSPGAGVSANPYIQTREYNSNSHQVSFHRTHYWNGTTSQQNCYAQLEITEYLET